MIVTPQSNFRIYSGIPFDSKYENTILFKDESAQKTYFATKQIYVYNDFTYVREQSKIKVPFVSDSLMSANYCAFQNEGFGSKWFYAFITDAEYVNNRTTAFTIELDVFQTWLFQMSIGKCFVEREHVSDDTVGLHTVPESVEIGKQVIGAESEWIQKLGMETYILPPGSISGEIKGNVYSSLKVYGYTQAQKTVMEDGLTFTDTQPERLPLLMMCPECVTNGAGGVQTYYEAKSISPLSNHSGYTPVNKKLLCSPYMYFTIDDFCGNQTELYFEQSGGGSISQAQCGGKGESDGDGKLSSTSTMNVSRETSLLSASTGEYSGNYYLTESQCLFNAYIVRDYLLELGWSINAICGILGNMRYESGINPGIYESLVVADSSGYGLVQWTPSTKFIDWANDRNYPIDDIEHQILRIKYEVENGGQWASTSSFTLSFSDFTTSTETPEYLTEAFMRCYERPGNFSTLQKRQDYARMLFNNWEGIEPSDPTEPDDPDVTSPVYGNILIQLAGVPLPKPALIAYPLNYAGSAKAMEMGIVYDNFPQCPWNSDTFKQWISYNGGSLAMQVAGNIMGGSGQAVRGDKIGGAMTAFGSVYNAVKQVEYQKMHSSQLHQGIGSAGIQSALGKVGFRFRTWCLKSEYAQIIDEYFTRYGYAVNRYKVPELNSREKFNFVKCSDCNITGSIPDDDVVKMENALERGITFWHITTIGDFSGTNPIVS